MDPCQTDIISKNVSWQAGFDAHGHLSVSTNGKHPVSFTRELISADTLNVDETMYTLQVGDAEGEPRLCPMGSLSGACSVMNSLSESEQKTLGNVIGFNLVTWFVANGTVSNSRVPKELFLDCI